MSRKTSRQHAFKIIYQFPFHKDFDLEDAMECYLSDVSDVEELTTNETRFIKGEVSGTLEHLTEIDELISKYSSGWTIDRISKIDLAIMRLSIFEILHSSDIPVSVSINEAVELAKLFSDDASSSFVNGILGKIASVA